MRNLPDVLRIIDGEYEEWVPVKTIVDDVEIAARVQTISCDTRDFALGWNFKQPKPCKKPDCNMDMWDNEGIARMRRLKDSPAIGDYLIDCAEIIPWLKNLCEKSGGFDKDWRYLDADVDGCRDWAIKYIRFVRRESGRFMVCNSYWMPVKWRKIIDNLKKLM